MSLSSLSRSSEQYIKNYCLWIFLLDYIAIHTLFLVIYIFKYLLRDQIFCKKRLSLIYIFQWNVLALLMCAIWEIRYFESLEALLLLGVFIVVHWLVSTSNIHGILIQIPKISRDNCSPTTVLHWSDNHFPTTKSTFEPRTLKYVTLYECVTLQSIILLSQYRKGLIIPPFKYLHHAKQLCFYDKIFSTHNFARFSIYYLSKTKI